MSNVHPRRQSCPGVFGVIGAVPVLGGVWVGCLSVDAAGVLDILEGNVHEASMATMGALGVSDSFKHNMLYSEK